MKVEALYNPLLVGAHTWEMVTDVAGRMHFNDVGAVAILEEGRLAGILTERDIARAVAERIDTDRTAVSDLMTTEIAVVEADTDAREAADMMLRLGVRHLPIVDQEGRLLGMISIRDVLQDVVWAGA